jgi:hypothetical protein
MNVEKILSAIAYLVEPEMVGGVPVYGASNWTAYA